MAEQPTDRPSSIQTNSNSSSRFEWTTIRLRRIRGLIMLSYLSGFLLVYAQYSKSTDACLFATSAAGIDFDPAVVAFAATSSKRAQGNESLSRGKITRPDYDGQLRYDSSDATVMAMAQGYPKYVHRRFVGSLRKSGFRGTIILAVEPNMQEGVEEYLISQNVTILEINYTACERPVFTEDQIDPRSANHKEANTCIHPYPDVKIRWGRYPFLRDALRDCRACTGPVLISDARDVLFQRDPFGDGVPPVEGLQLYAEHRSITAEHKFVAARVKRCKNGYTMNGPMLCSGTTIADRSSMLRYLETMYREMKHWMIDCHYKSHGGDQAILNYLYYSGQLDFLNPQIYRPRDGTVNTVGVVGRSIGLAHYRQNKTVRAVHRVFQGANDKTWLGVHFDQTDANGFIVDYDGQWSRVVHQYDRFGPSFGKWLTKREGELY